MCLSRISDAIHKPYASGFGWKMFIYNDKGCLVSWLNLLRMGREDPYEINRWYEAYGFAEDEKEPYWRGFHVFNTLRGAELWSRGVVEQAIRKVRWRYRLATGMQSFGVNSIPCIVAKEILILP